MVNINYITTKHEFRIITYITIQTELNLTERNCGLDRKRETTAMRFSLVQF